METDASEIHHQKINKINGLLNPVESLFFFERGFTW